MDSVRPVRLMVVGLTWPVETFLKRLLTGLAESGIEVTVASARRPDEAHLQWLPTPAWRGSRTVRALRSAVASGLAWRRSSGEARLVLNRAGQDDPRRQAKAWHDLAPLVGRDWDVLYFPWNSAAAARLPLLQLGRPVVVSCRGSQMNVAPHNPQRRSEVGRFFAALERATVVHCVSGDLESSVVDQGVGREKIRVIRPAVDPDFFCPGEPVETRRVGLRLVTTGSLIWRKGHEHLLVAMASLRASGVDAHLRIIGDGPERQRVLFTVRDLGLDGDVDLLGGLDETGVRDELRQADLFVLSSLSEGISNAALEAMSCGLPVVTTDVGGMSEVIREGVEGRLVPPRDPSALAEAMAHICADRETRLRMGAAARDRVESEFHLRGHLAAWRELLDVAMRQHRAGAAR